jgi:hypothetical protein
MVRYNVIEFMRDRAGRDFLLSLISLIRGQVVVALDEPKVLVASGLCSVKYTEYSPEIDVDCLFYIPAHWRSTMPSVRVEPSILYKMEMDWHADGKGMLCVEHPEVWRHVVKESSGQGESWAGVRAAVFLFESTKLLLCRHKLGAKYKMQKWPSEWEYWAHGNGADKQLKLWNKSN